MLLRPLAAGPILIPAFRPKAFSYNIGLLDNGDIDWGFILQRHGYYGVAALAHGCQADINKLSDEHFAQAARVVVLKVSSTLLRSPPADGASSTVVGDLEPLEVELARERAMLENIA